SAVADAMLIHHLEPTPRLDATEVRGEFDHLDPDGKFRQRLQELPDYVRMCETVRARVAELPVPPAATAADPAADPRITLLGTGAALPSRYRNVSSTLVDVPGYGGILLDAGEGTLGQLFRKFGGCDGGGGLPAYADVVGGIRVLFISHMHADHHIGAVAVILEWLR
ncbi:hypothetical protein HK405_011550, partial [Cladochytrium tenue]